MLANNSLTGGIPHELENCSSLLWLNLANNQLSGPISPQLARIGSGSEECFAMKRIFEDATYKSRKDIKCVELPLTQHELYKHIVIDPPRDLLFYGLPNTGKTMHVKAVANHTIATLIRVFSLEFVQKYLEIVDSPATDNYRIDFPSAKLFSPVDELCIASHHSSLFSCILWEALFNHRNKFVRPSLKPNHTDDNSSSNTIFFANLKVLFIKDLLQRLIDMFAEKEVPHGAKKKTRGPWKFIGLLPFVDLSRDIVQAQSGNCWNCGVNVKMITRDQLISEKLCATAISTSMDTATAVTSSERSKL
ncbi:26S protease regulatory subunit 6B -like protein [Capsicum chinense]|nr:26S protease regulatory subunit 6B -like protein [Capsicum chinense]